MSKLIAVFVIIVKILRIQGVLRFFLRRKGQPVVVCFHELNRSSFSVQLDAILKIYSPLKLKQLLEGNFSGSLDKSKMPSVAFTLDDCLERDMEVSVMEFGKRQLHCTYFLPLNYSESQKAMWPNKLRDLFDKTTLKLQWLDSKTLEFNSEFEKQTFVEGLIVQYLYSEQSTEEVESEVDYLIEINNIKLDPKHRVIGRETVEGLLSRYPESVDFQSHTMSHLKLSQSTDAKIDQEFEQSSEILSKWTQRDQYSICYPYGSQWHIGEHWNNAKEFFSFGFSLESRTLSKRTNRLNIPRVGLYPSDDETRVLLKLLQASLKRE